MKAVGKFLLLETNEFESWLNMQVIKRKILLIQQHHTYIPAYKHFTGDNYFLLCQSMEKSHIARGFDQIAQNFTTFPDGTIMVCRNIDIVPAGIKGANANGVCIENLGNFDKKGDVMTENHKNCIITVTASLLRRFKLEANEQTIVYHHWYDLTKGKRILTEGTGETKSCPGTNFFEGNTVADFRNNLLPLF